MLWVAGNDRSRVEKPGSVRSPIDQKVNMVGVQPQCPPSQIQMIQT